MTLKTKLDGKYDEILISHGNGEGYIGLIEDVISVCEDIKRDNTDDLPMEFLGTHGLIAKKDNLTNGKGNIVYNKNRIYKKDTIIE